MVIVLSVLLRITASDYFFDIFQFILNDSAFIFCCTCYWTMLIRKTYNDYKFWVFLECQCNVRITIMCFQRHFSNLKNWNCCIPPRTRSISQILLVASNYCLSRCRTCCLLVSKHLYINIQIMDNPNVILYLHRSRWSNRYSSIFLCNYYIIRCQSM
jgi:hypothetical protein